MMLTKSADFLSARNCPSCDEAAGGPFRSASIPAETLEIDALRSSWSGFFKGNVFFTYSRCPRCGLLYSPVYFNGKTLTSMYGSMADNTNGQPIALMKATQEGYFAVWRSFGPAEGNYAEIGPDIGLFAELCAQQCSFSEYHFWEPNRTVHERLAASVSGKECHIHADMFSLEVIPDNHLDLMVMIHVLDHLIEPAHFLAEVRRKMKKTGRLLIVTHNEASLMAKVLGRRWPAFCLQHPQLFSPFSMRGILGRQGFRVEAIKRTTNHFPMTYLLRHALYAAGMRIPIPEWGRPSIPLKLGNIATVASVDANGATS